MVNIHVIIPVYNTKHFLREAVESVLSQPYKGIDIVLVNDGSTDGSAELCDEIAAKEKRVSVIHQANAGVSAARNTGIDFVLDMGTNDDYIAFLDSDDKWCNDFFDSDTISLLCKDYSLVGFQSSMCSWDLSKRKEAIPMTEGVFSGGVSSVWLHAVQHFGAMMYSCKLISQYGLRFPLVKYSEDRSFIMQCIFLADKMCLVNRLMYLYRQNPLSAVHTRPFGIQYYVPIINTWIQTDDMMAEYANVHGGELREGYILARIYIMDLLDEHYRLGGKPQELKEVFLSNKKFIELWHTKSGSEKLRKRFKFVEDHPVIHRVWNKTYGIVWRFLLKIKKTKIARYVVEKRRYTITV